MPDLDPILAHAKTILAIASAAVSGVLVKLYDTYLKADSQEHTQAMDLVQTLRQDMSGLRDRQDRVEAKLVESQRRETLLTAQVQLLIQRIDILLDELAQHRDVPDGERDRYKSLPSLD